MKLILVLASLFILGAASSVYADTIDWQKCAAAANHHCTIIMPSAVKSVNPNYFVTVNFVPNGSPVMSGVLSNQNYTALQNSVGVMRVVSTATTSSPNINFCPIALTELKNQGVPEYLDRFYNASMVPPLNLTHSIYPEYCYVETGPNPIDGSHVVTVPEFPNAGIIVGFILLITSSIVIAKSKQLRLK